MGTIGFQRGGLSLCFQKILDIKGQAQENTVATGYVAQKKGLSSNGNKYRLAVTRW